MTAKTPPAEAERHKIQAKLTGPAEPESRLRRAQPRAKASPPEFIPFQHPTLVTAPPVGEGWIHEVKFDGYRMQVRVADSRAEWRSRNANNWTARFGDLAELFEALPDCILDGEVCVLDASGHPDFSALRSALGRRQAGVMAGSLVYFVFDILYLAGEGLTGHPLSERKARLRSLIEPEGAPLSPHLRFVEAIDADARRLFSTACEMGLEGIVSKRLDASYRSGDRSDSWVKVKCRPAQEVVIGGWKTTGSRFRSLMAGVWEGDQLRYVGSVHTGYSDAKSRELLPSSSAWRLPRPPSG